MDKLVVLAEVNDNAEAGLIKSYLEDDGIECVVNDSISNQMFGSFIDMSGVKILVMEDAFEKAVEVMKKGGFEKYLL
ncbi:MAG: DUF2007 domain-containing protein [Bacteroidales bacterium]|nr:DUF2007 domain-containing protein [Bacteroidales bacterium]